MKSIGKKGKRPKGWWREREIERVVHLFPCGFESLRIYNHLVYFLDVMWFVCWVSSVIFNVMEFSCREKGQKMIHWYWVLYVCMSCELVLELWWVRGQKWGLFFIFNFVMFIKNKIKYLTLFFALYESVMDLRD